MRRRPTALTADDGWMLAARSAPLAAAHDPAAGGGGAEQRDEQRVRWDVRPELAPHPAPPSCITAGEAGAVTVERPTGRTTLTAPASPATVQLGGAGWSRVPSLPAPRSCIPSSRGLSVRHLGRRNEATRTGSDRRCDRTGPWPARAIASVAKQESQAVESSSTTFAPSACTRLAHHPGDAALPPGAARLLSAWRCARPVAALVTIPLGRCDRQAQRIGGRVRGDCSDHAAVRRTRSGEREAPGSARGCRLLPVSSRPHRAVHAILPQPELWRPRRSARDESDPARSTLRSAVTW